MTPDEDRVLAAQRRLAAAAAEVVAASSERSAAIRALLASGHSLADVARLLGVSRSAIHQAAQ